MQNKTRCQSQDRQDPLFTMAEFDRFLLTRKAMKWVAVAVAVIVLTGAAADKGHEAQETEKQSETVKSNEQRRPPNIVILVADDLGIGDLGCYGNNTLKTPNIDSLAKGGMQLTHHLAAAGLCSPSRAALLTGRYPARYGMVGQKNTPSVIVQVASKVGLPSEEITLAEALAAANYTTAAVGKWHLGSGCGLLGKGCLAAQQHGFHHFFGLPLTLLNEYASTQPFFYFPCDGSDPFYQILLTVAVVSVVTLWWQCGRHPLLLFICFCVLSTVFSITWFFYTHYGFHTNKWWKVSPWMNRHLNNILIEDGVVLQQPVILEGLSQQLASHSVGLIAKYARDEQPFFLYHSFAHVHTPMFTVPQMAGRSAQGRYGDNVEEMDAALGEILAALHEHNLEDNTIVYFVSDHGAHLEAIDEDGQRSGGYNGLFKGGKGMGAAEGGIRVPGIYRWPGHILAGVKVDAPTSLLDTLPTILELAGLPPLHELLPHLPYRELDGMSITDVLTKNAHAPSRTLIHHCDRNIHALRFIYEENVFKMHLAGNKWKPGSTQCGWGSNVMCSCYDVEDYSQEPRLYNLRQDPYEDSPIPVGSSKYNQIVGIMLQFLAEWQARVSYPPSMLSSVSDTALSPWLQPFRIPS
uniref:Sulfatase N-terminal domain-containing protein n=1 Tax=Scylla olivacea TaxID=85551 RepID=A0A0P4WJV3_SCYOL